MLQSIGDAVSRVGLCSDTANMWPTSDCIPRFKVWGDPQRGIGYVATRPTFEPLLF